MRGGWFAFTKAMQVCRPLDKRAFAQAFAGAAFEEWSRKVASDIDSAERWAKAD
jgi:hypothetical protein